MTREPKEGGLKGLYPIIDTHWVEAEKAARTAESILKSASGHSGEISVIQLRGKESGSGELLKAAREMRAVTSAHNTLFIVNDRVDIALMSGADGVHLGQEDIPIKEARALLGPEKIIGISTHNEDEALGAIKSGADYISFGPIFATQTKKDAHPPGGIEGLKEISAAIKARPVPIAAIGGITSSTLGEVLSCGASMTALISEILLAEDIPATVKALIKEKRPSPSQPPG